MKTFLAALRGLLLLAAWLASGPLMAQSPGKTEVLWLGQSAFRLTTPSGKVIVTDPWLKTNPATPADYKALDKLGKVDLILVSHGHFDHIADAPALATLNKARVYAPGDLNQTLTVLGVLPPEQLPRMNKGGTVAPFADVPGIKITEVRAEHSSVYVWKNPATGKDETHPGGEPIGYIIEMENGFRIWHMGDTGLFGDMKWIAEHYKPDLVMIPIGGRFTMDAADAAYALRELIKPKYAIPMHYREAPGQKTPPEQLVEALGASATKLILMKPGEKVEF
jgi:L-ascorbate metabolism protein UlaG (beta-lactamase superfamily)